jgi:hypothetical protein
MEGNLSSLMSLKNKILKTDFQEKKTVKPAIFPKRKTQNYFQSRTGTENLSAEIDFSRQRKNR